MTGQPTPTKIVSNLLDIVIDEIEQCRERIVHLEAVKAWLERLIPAKGDNEPD